MKSKEELTRIYLDSKFWFYYRGHNNTQTTNTIKLIKITISKIITIVQNIYCSPFYFKDKIDINKDGYSQ